MVKLVATLGKTVGGVAETIINLSEGNYVAPFDPKPVKVDELIIVKTKEVEEVYNVLSSLILCCTGIDKVTTVSLPFNDVESPKDFIEVRETVRGIIRAGDYLDFTGGRKAISAAAVLAAREMGAHLVTSIIPHEEYDVLNKEYLRVKDVALRVYRKTDCVKSLCNLVSPHARTIVFF
ncbi:MAG: CRISPR-associated ring nuclease Crn1 [Sulfolobus sp.]